MNEAKVKAREERLRILKDIDTIEATVCKACPVSKLRTYEKQGKHLCNGCEHFAKINALGEDMIAVTNASRSVPDVLNKSAYELLKDRDWTDKEIQKHYGISNNDFDFFLSQNQLNSRKNLNGFTSRIHFDVNAYTEWVMQGKTDVAFCEYYGMSVSTLKVHKKKFGVKTSAIPKPPKPPKPKRVRKKPKKVQIDAQPIQSKSEGNPMAKISVDVYESHRERKMKDKDIAKLHNMSMPSLYQFKSKNGLSNKRKLADPAPVEPTAEDKAFIEAYENKELDLEPVALVEPAEMPSIESDWKPAEVVVNLAELAEKVSDEPETPLPNPVIIQQQYEIDKWKREAELWKFRQKETEQKFFDLSGDFRELEVDFTNFKTYCRTIEKENAELKETVILNHLLMKQSVRFLDRLDAMLENPKEASEFVWR